MNANSIYPDFWKERIFGWKKFYRPKNLNNWFNRFYTSLTFSSFSFPYYLLFVYLFGLSSILSFIYCLAFFSFSNLFLFSSLLTSFLPFFLYSSLSSFLSPFPFLKSFPSMNIKEYTPLEISIILYMRGKV